MARIAVEDITRVMACTPHIYPGLYMNDSLRHSADGTSCRNPWMFFKFRCSLWWAPMPIWCLTAGGGCSRAGCRRSMVRAIFCWNRRTMWPRHLRFENSVFQIMAAGFVPVITHPERLVWIEHHYSTFIDLAQRGLYGCSSRLALLSASLASGPATGVSVF